MDETVLIIDDFSCSVAKNRHDLEMEDYSVSKVTIVTKDKIIMGLDREFSLMLKKSFVERCPEIKLLRFGYDTNGIQKNGVVIFCRPEIQTNCCR